MTVVSASLALMVDAGFAGCWIQKPLRIQTDPVTAAAVQEETQEEPFAEEQAPEPEVSGDAEDTAWEDRKLCSDESCIGTIGPDGRCTVCGLTG